MTRIRNQAPSGMVIEEKNLSVAWARACSAACKAKGKELRPLVVCITGFDDNNDPYESMALRNELDRELRVSTKNKLSINTVANTIFPMSLWEKHKDREKLFKDYRKILPKLRKCRHNKNGIYFERMIAYPRMNLDRQDEDSGKIPINQLDQIITHWKNCRSNGRGPKKRNVQMILVDPHKDLGQLPFSIFPCLHQVSFDYNYQTRTICVVGYYPSQYLLERAYGNYLGLARLGKFMAHELGGLRLDRVTCITAIAKREHQTSTKLQEAIQTELEKAKAACSENDKSGV